MLIPLSVQTVGVNDDGITRDLANPSTIPAFILNFILEEEYILGLYAEDRFFRIDTHNPCSKLEEIKRGHPIYVAAQQVLTHFSAQLAAGKTDIEVDLINAKNLHA